MKKIISVLILLSFLLLAVSCGDAGLPNITQNTTAAITWEAPSDDSKDGNMKFSFELGCDYTKIILTVNGGSLICTTDEEGTPAEELTLKRGEAFYWVPGEGSQEHAIIAIQICNQATTLHCGTLSFIKQIDETSGAQTYKVVLDSDDGLNIRQNEGEASVVIHAE
jgi:hypothetical protein